MSARVLAQVAFALGLGLAVVTIRRRRRASLASVEELDSSEARDLPRVDEIEVLRQMGKLVASNMGRRADSQEGGKMKSPAVFFSHFDWHSSVHAHWALFRVNNYVVRCRGRMIDRPSGVDAQTAFNAITAENVLKEVEDLRADPSFEMPYGRAWVLRLALDYHTWTGGLRHHLQPLSELCVETLLKTLAPLLNKPPAVLDACRDQLLAPDYKNASFALWQLHDYLVAMPDVAERDEHLRTLRKLVEKLQSAAPKDFSFASDRTSGQFFSPYGNFVTLLWRVLRPDRLIHFLQLRVPDDEDLTPIPVTTVHSLGLNWSRAWAFRVLARTYSDADVPPPVDYQRAYLQHVEAGLAMHAKIQGTGRFEEFSSFYAYDHWVPQFAVLALTIV